MTDSGLDVTVATLLAVYACNGEVGDRDGHPVGPLFGVGVASRYRRTRRLEPVMTTGLVAELVVLVVPSPQLMVA